MRDRMRNTRFGILIPAVLVAFLLFSLPARADLVFSLEPGTTAAAGSTGNAFDVLLTNTGSSPVTVAGFSFGITTSDTDISFTGATTSTVTAPYVFAGDSFDDINGFPLYTNPLPSQTLEASDLSNSGAGDSIAGGITVGVGSVEFDVASGAAPGSFAVTFEAYPTTSLADQAGNALDFTTENGTITITGVAPTPEAPTSALLICAMGLAILIRRQGRRKISTRLFHGLYQQP